MKDCDCSEEVVLTEFKESVAEETMGNKDEYQNTRWVGVNEK